MMRVLYVINGFDPGGAEHGLLSLIREGFFSSVDIRIFAFCHGRGDLAEGIERCAGANRVHIVSRNETLSWPTVFAATFQLARELDRWKPQIVVLSLKQANVVGRMVLTFFPGIHCVSFEHIARYRARKAERMYQYVLHALSFRVNEIW